MQSTNRAARRLVVLILMVAFVAAATSGQPALVAVAGDGKAGALSVAWADYDNDGDLDLARTYASGEVELHRNDGGRLVAPDEPLRLASGEARAAAWGDYDADGDVDLYVGARRGENALFRNDGDEGFTNVAADLGLTLPDINARQASWIDYDNDGRVDLFVADRSGPNRLFRNDGDRFVDVGERLGIADPRPAVGACWFDYEQDGDLDLFVTNQNGEDDALFRNRNGRFSDVAGDAGLVPRSRDESEGGVGCTVGDYDNDGDLDVFVATYGRDLLYRNDGNGRFSEVGETMGFAGSTRMVGASWGDYDNDGHPDLYVAGYVRAGDVRQPDAHLYRNRGRGRGDRFVDVLERGSPLNDADHGVQWADFDGDGLLDLAVTDGYDAAGRAVLFHNRLPAKRHGGSLQVAVLDARGHHTRAGAEVRLYDASGALLGTRLVPTGDGYNSQGTQPLHFGLAGDERVTVAVTFLTETGRVTQRIPDVDPRQWTGKTFTVRQQARNPVANHD